MLVFGDRFIIKEAFAENILHVRGNLSPFKGSFQYITKKIVPDISKNFIFDFPSWYTILFIICLPGFGLKKNK